MEFHQNRRVRGNGAALSSNGVTLYIKGHHYLFAGLFLRCSSTYTPSWSFEASLIPRTEVVLTGGAPLARGDEGPWQDWYQYACITRTHSELWVHHPPIRAQHP